MRPYVVQLAGALALYKGYVAEMATGEGKTLTAALAATLRGWIGRPCHIVTVNDYLAARDAKWMEPLYRLCNVTVGHVIGEMDTDARRDGHHNDVVYTTGKEIVADFLRDRLWLGRLQKAPRRQIAWLLGRQRDVDRGLVTRGIHSAIVDEADSVLIDEAVTPLIISKAAPNDSFVEACNLASRIAGELSAGKDYTVDDRYRDVELKSHVHDIVSSQVAAFDGSFRSVRGYMDLVHQAVIAREFFHRDDQYVVQDDQVVIVDEFTGRQMPQRKWRAGLHQFVEAKEGIDMTTPTETLARLSFQRFYRFFHVLAGMTGTARESAGELWDIYELPTLSIPENKPCQRVVRRPQAFADAESKWQAIVAEVAAMHDQGRPVLVGTRSVQASETLSRRLDEVGITHQLLNAVRHAEEAVIVSGAGDRGAVTIATNMAGRGTDIKLARGVAALGGLHVIASEGHESKRIDRQLFGRCARQGDPGSARLFISMEDELIRRYVAAPIRTSISAQLGRGVPGAGSAAMAALGWAQQTAQRIAYQRRRSVLRMDTWLEDSLSFAYREVS
jgi:preprotein translocase subunit SecA